MHLCLLSSPLRGRMTYFSRGQRLHRVRRSQPDIRHCGGRRRRTPHFGHLFRGPSKVGGGDDGDRTRGIFNQVGPSSQREGEREQARPTRRGQHLDLLQRSRFDIRLGGEIAREMKSHGTLLESPMSESLHPSRPSRGRKGMHALSSGLSSGNPLAEAGRLAVSHPPPLISALKPQSGHRSWDGSLYFKVIAPLSDQPQPRDLLSWG